MQRALAVVERAGYGPKNPLKLSMVVATSIRGYPEIAGFVKSSWKEIGVDVELINIASYKDAIEAMKTGKYNLMINSFYQIAPHQYVYRPEAIGDWAFRYSQLHGYVDGLVSRMSRSSGEEYAALVLETERHMMETMTMIPIVDDSQIGFYADRLAPNQRDMPKLQLRYFTPK